MPTDAGRTADIARACVMQPAGVVHGVTNALALATPATIARAVLIIGELERDFADFSPYARILREIACFFFEKLGGSSGRVPHAILGPWRPWDGLGASEMIKTNIFVTYRKSSSYTPCPKQEGGDTLIAVQGSYCCALSSEG